MFEEEIKKIISVNCNQPLSELNISILGEKYLIYANYSKSIEYFKRLFYPNGVNGVSVIGNIEKKDRPIIIRCFQNIRKNDFLKLASILKKSWKSSGKVSPVINGYYQVYENGKQKCFVQDYANNTSEEHMIWIKEGEYAIVSIKSDHEYMILSRFVREIGFRMLENEGYIGLHASAIEMDSQGYLIIGDSGVGKSTLALTLSKFFKTTYISNDRIMVKFTNDGVKAVPFGMPIKVNYGTLKTLEVEDDFRNWDNTIPLVSTKTFYDFNGENKLNLLPVELKKYMNIKVGSSMKVKGIILPYIKEQGKKETDSVYQIVKRNCYYKKEPVYVEDWLGINIKRDFWSYEKIMDELLHLKIYRTEISISEFRKSAENIVHLIENSKEMGAR